MALSRARENLIVAEIRRNPDAHIVLKPAEYLRADGAVAVYRGGEQEFLHRRLYRLLIDPQVGRERLARTCSVRGCLNPNHLRPTGARLKGGPDQCINGHRYTEENTTPAGHCRICTEARQARRNGHGRNGGELNAEKTACPQGHSYLIPEQVYRYRTRSGWHRKCRVCARERARKVATKDTQA